MIYIKRGFVGVLGVLRTDKTYQNTHSDILKPIAHLS